MSAITFRPTFLRLLPLAAAGLIAACSSNPVTVGDYAVEQGKKWNRGTEMVQDGQDLIKDGNEQIADGNDEIREGNQKVTKGKNLISQGNALIAEAEAAIKAQQLNIGQPQNPNPAMNPAYQ